MRGIITLILGFMILGQVGNMELSTQLNGQAIFKLFILLVMFYLAAKKYMK